MNLTTCPKPGIYQDVSLQEYRQWNAVSYSRVALAAKSPAHYRHGRSGEFHGCLRVANLVHCGVLDPLALAKRYCFMPDFARMPQNTNSLGERSYSSSTCYVRAMQAKFRQLHPNQEIISESEYERLVGAARGLYENDLARELLSVGRPEVCVVWDDQPSGLRCKVRIDWLRIESGAPDAIVADLATTRDAAAFQQAIATYGYHRRLAFQQRGLIAAGLASDIQPWIIAVETQAPFACRVARLSDEAFALGADEIDGLIDLITRCKANASWPAYENPAQWDIPEDYIALGCRSSASTSTESIVAS